MDVMTFGRMAVFADPTGAAFSVWQPRDHIGSGLRNEPGACCWNELTTRDASSVADFYRAVFDPRGAVFGVIAPLTGRAGGHPREPARPARGAGSGSCGSVLQ